MVSRFAFPLVLTLLASSALTAQTAAPKRYDSERVSFIAETIMTGMRGPSAMAFLPDRKAIVIERPTAKIHLLDLDSGAATLLTGGPAAFAGHAPEAADVRRAPALTGQDSGLHDSVLHPDYRNSGWIYLSYSTGVPERSTTAVDRFHLRGAELVDRQAFLPLTRGQKIEITTAGGCCFPAATSF